jgi:UPF0271 protein
MRIDLNCDLGEGCLHDDELLALTTSANIACGAHAGDANTALATLTGAARHGVSVGAHPGFFDRDHFGRRELKRQPAEIYNDCVYQIGALIALARVAGTPVRYLKAHGALYNMACRDDSLAATLLQVAEFFDLPIVGLPGSKLETVSLNRVRFVAEGFADRRYRSDGSLLPRDQPDALVDDPAEAVSQAMRLIQKHGVETLCVHGDNPQAVAFVRGLRTSLERAGFQIQAFV